MVFLLGTYIIVIHVKPLLRSHQHFMCIGPQESCHATNIYLQVEMSLTKSLPPLDW